MCEGERVRESVCVCEEEIEEHRVKETERRKEKKERK